MGRPPAPPGPGGPAGRPGVSVRARGAGRSHRTGRRPAPGSRGNRWRAGTSGGGPGSSGRWSAAVRRRTRSRASASARAEAVSRSWAVVPSPGFGGACSQPWSTPSAPASAEPAFPHSRAPESPEAAVATRCRGGQVLVEDRGPYPFGQVRDGCGSHGVRRHVGVRQPQLARSAVFGVPPQAPRLQVRHLAGERGAAHRQRPQPPGQPLEAERGGHPEFVGAQLARDRGVAVAQRGRGGLQPFGGRRARDVQLGERHVALGPRAGRPRWVGADGEERPDPGDRVQRPGRRRRPGSPVGLGHRCRPSSPGLAGALGRGARCLGSDQASPMAPGGRGPAIAAGGGGECPGGAGRLRG